MIATIRNFGPLLVLLSLHVVLVPSVGAQTAIQLTSVDVIQRTPGSLSEDYTRGWSLTARVAGVNPVGSAGGLLYVSVLVSENHPATIGASGPCAGTQNDLYLSDSTWRDPFSAPTPPAPARPAGKGGPASFQLDANTGEGAVPQPFSTDFTFGTLCDDVRIEETETFSVRVWFEPLTDGPDPDANGQVPHNGAGLATDLVINDDEIEPQAPSGVQARGTAGTRNGVTVAWSEPRNAVDAGVESYLAS